MAGPTDSRIIAYLAAVQAATHAAMVARWTPTDLAIQAGQVGPEEAADIYGTWRRASHRASQIRDEFVIDFFHRIPAAADELLRHNGGRLSVIILVGAPAPTIQPDYRVHRHEEIGEEIHVAMIRHDARPTTEEVCRFLVARILPRMPELYAAPAAGLGLERCVSQPETPVPFPA